MNHPCNHCKAKGYIQRDGKMVGNRQPYTLACPVCNGVGHYRDRYDFVPTTHYGDDGLGVIFALAAAHYDALADTEKVVGERLANGRAAA